MILHKAFHLLPLKWFWLTLLYLLWIHLPGYWFHEWDEIQNTLHFLIVASFCIQMKTLPSLLFFWQLFQISVIIATLGSNVLKNSTGLSISTSSPATQHLNLRRWISVPAVKCLHLPFCWSSLYSNHCPKALRAPPKLFIHWANNISQKNLY